MSDLKAQLKAEAARPRDELVAALVEAGVPEGDILPHWGDARLRSELKQAERVRARKAEREAARGVKPQVGVADVVWDESEPEQEPETREEGAEE